ncbi:uncharacterized protein M6B38_305155 [Iris pallida]|uniref:Uncharacterized protein n=1 Tax=Iris pallida TaxID=29817 RepID=A0AAX6HLW9_IRIPA|nr:uncharacterized protein M6B38_305155 [Iris pallida]
MVSEEPTEVIYVDVDEEEAAAPKLSKFRQFKLRIPPIKARLSPSPRLLDFLKARPSRDWLGKLRLSSPLAVFRRTVTRREEVSLSVPSPAGLRRGFHVRFFRKIDWPSVLNICREWLSHPLNIGLLVWLLLIVVVAAFLVLLLLGALNHAIRSKQARSGWVETCNQTLNALFTLMSLYQHPTLLHHLFMLCRWSSEDVAALRKIYCRNGAYRPHEWAHMMVVAVLIQIAFLSQYALCAVYWLYPSARRPEYLEDIFGGTGLLAPVAAGVYTLYGPLGREPSCPCSDEEPNYKDVGRSDTKRVVVSRPEWAGGLFDCRDDATVGGLSFFCTCCVFGWNMERLGFGNMYVHIVTFVLLCFAPFWIFSTTALKVGNAAVGEAMWASGVVLCALGLLYGGFWRTQMRRKFGLPGNPLCCGSPALTDYFQWMFCWSCSLAQEVRTGNFYDVEDDGLYRKLLDSDEEESQTTDGERGSSPAAAVGSDCDEPVLPVSTASADSGVALIPPVQPLILLGGSDNASTIVVVAQPSLPVIQGGQSQFGQV